VAEKVFARQTTDGLWQWRLASVEGQWATDVYHSGDDEAMVATARTANAPVNLLVNGNQVVCCSTEIDAKEKRHMAKLLPYELEEQVIDNIEEMHLAFCSAEDDRINVAYISNKDMEKSLAPLIELNCDTRIVVPDYLTLRRDNNGVTLVLDEQQLIVRTGTDEGFSVEDTLAPFVLSEQEQELDFTCTVNLVAESDEQLDILASWLPASWTRDNGPEIIRNIGGLWDWLEPAQVNQELNLRRGTFSRQLPIKRWLTQWKTPLIAIAAAYLIAVTVTYAQYLGLKSEQKEIVASMNAIYLKAVPKGRAGDPEGRLEKLVKNIKGGAKASSNLMVLLGGVADTLKTSGNIAMSSFRYNADQGELLLNIEGSNFGELESLRTGVEEKGFKAELLRVEAKGERQSARMKVSEAP